MSLKITGRKGSGSSNQRRPSSPTPQDMPQVDLTSTKGTGRYGLVFVVVCLAYFCTLSDSYLGLFSDGRDMFWTAVSLHEFGELAIPLVHYPSPGSTVETDRYAKYGLGYPILQQLPLLLAGRVEKTFREGHSNILFALTNMFLTASASLLVALSLRNLGYRFHTAAWAALAFSFGTFVWPYISYDFSEPLQTFCLVLSFWFLVKALRCAPPSRLFLVLAGFVLGFGILTKAFLVTLIPSYILYLWISLQPPVSQRIKSSSWFFLPLVIWGAGMAALNLYRFGSVFEFGYERESGEFTTPLTTGLYGLLLSPNKGLLFYAPVSTLALWSLWKTSGRQRCWSIFLVSLLSVYILPTSMWWSWEGGTSWGPRLLLPIVPFLVISAAMLLEHVKLSIVPFIACVVIGTVVNLLGVLVPMPTWNYVLELNNGMRVPLDVTGRPPQEYIEKDGKKWFLPAVASNYLPNLSPILGHAWLLRLRYFDQPFALQRLKDTTSVPPDPVDFPPVKVYFGLLKGVELDYALWQLGSAHFWLWDTLAGRRREQLIPEPIYGLALENQGDRAIAQGNLQRALTCFRLTQELMPNAAFAAIKLSQVEFRLGNPLKAELTLVQFLQRNPLEPLPRLVLAGLYEATGRLQDALNTYSTFQALHPNDENLAMVQQRVRELSAATAK